MIRNVRMAPPILGGGNNPISVNGRSYSVSIGSFVDMPDFDATVASGNGWLQLGIVGTTAQRPVPADSDFPVATKHPYLDTTLSKAIVWDRSNQVWRDPFTGAAA